MSVGGGPAGDTTENSCEQPAGAPLAFMDLHSVKTAHSLDHEKKFQDKSIRSRFDVY